MHHVLAALHPGEWVVVPTGQDALEINLLPLPDCHTKSSIQEEVEDSFHLQTGLKFKEETSTLLYMQYSLAWCWKLDTSELISEKMGSFEMWWWRKMEISWTDRVENEGVLRRVQGV